MAEGSRFNTESLMKVINEIKRGGVSGMMSKVRYRMNSIGGGYDGWFKELHEPGEDELKQQREIEFKKQPLISILVSVYMTPETFLREMIESVLAQTYANWELVIVDGSRNDVSGPGGYFEGEAERVITEYMEKDSRIKYRIVAGNSGISSNINKAFSNSKGDYIAFLDHDDVLTPDALFCVAAVLNEEDYDIVYTDEDKMSEDGRRYSDPVFKPDFSIDLLRSFNYINKLMVVKRELISEARGLRSEFDGAEDYDLALRLSRIAGSVCHIPRVLYHRRTGFVPSDVTEHKREYQQEMEKKALIAYLKENGIMGTVMHTPARGILRCVYDTPGNPMVSIIVAGGGDLDQARKCIRPLYEKARYADFELIIVDPGEDAETSAYYRRVEKARKNCKVVDYVGVNRIAYLRNFGVTLAHSDYLLFLDPNVSVFEPSAMGEMLGRCMLDDAGLVAGVLYNEKEQIISQGTAIGVGGAYTNLFKGVRRGDYGYMKLNLANYNVSAALASCLMIKKADFKKLGGFSEKFASELCDLDFSLRAREMGLNVTVIAEAAWKVVGGPVLRGAQRDMSADERIREQKKEEDLFNVLWAHYYQKGDPFYNANFSRRSGSFSL